MCRVGGEYVLTSFVVFGDIIQSVVHSLFPEFRFVAFSGFATVCTAALALATPAGNAGASLELMFIDGVPADTFEFQNTGDCDLGEVEMWVELEGSAAGLVFDVSEVGAGVDMFHRLEITTGSDYIYRVSKLRDGDTKVLFELERLPAGASVAFQVDIDDTLEVSAGGNRQVLSDELEGVTFGVSDNWTQFETGSSATVANIPCEQAL